nr:adenylosuccinate lyase [Bacteriovoracaceae bacterium]
RTIRSHLTIAHENIALWHERDISHSSTERMYLPDHLGLTLYSLRRLNKTLNNLVILKENIEAKVQKHFDYLASLYLHHLIEQTDRPREELYEILQTASFTSKTREEFYENILKLCEDKKITVTNLPNPTDLRKIYLKEVDSIFNRVLN